MFKTTYAELEPVANALRGVEFALGTLDAEVSAFYPDNGREVLGVGRLSKVHGANEAEFAIVISDAWQNRGLGWGRAPHHPFSIVPRPLPLGARRGSTWSILHWPGALSGRHRRSFEPCRKRPWEK